MSGRLGFTMMPKVESDYAFVQVELPYGSSAAKSEAVRDQFLDAANRVMEANGGEKLVEGMDTKIGGAGRDISGSHVVKIKVYLTAADVRPISTDAFVAQWRQQVGDIPGLESVSFAADKVVRFR